MYDGPKYYKRPERRRIEGTSHEESNVEVHRCWFKALFLWIVAGSLTTFLGVIFFPFVFLGVMTVLFSPVLAFKSREGACPHCGENMFLPFGEKGKCRTCGTKSRVVTYYGGKKYLRRII